MVSGEGLLDSRAIFTALVGLVALQRLLEMRLSRRNARMLAARGAIEAGRGHLGTMILMHATLLAAAPLEVWLMNREFRPLPGLAFLAGFAAAQALRIWTIRTLGERWSIRVLVVPGSRPVTGGPFRLMRHPNYLAVACEIVFLPAIHGAYLTAFVFSVWNALLMRARIHCEETLLSEVGGYDRFAARTGRFFTSSRTRGEG